MHEAVDDRMPLGDGFAQSRELIVVLDVANVRFRLGGKAGDGLLPVAGADRVDDLGPGFSEQLPHVPGHALAIGQPADDDRFAGELQKIHGAMHSTTHGPQSVGLFREST
jgi:hypothetical protein